MDVENIDLVEEWLKFREDYYSSGDYNYDPKIVQLFADVGFIKSIDGVVIGITKEGDEFEP